MSAAKKRASARQLRAALEKFLDRSASEEERLDAASPLLLAIASRAPKPKPAVTEERPRFHEQPIPVDRRDRANGHLQEAYYVLEALHEVGVNKDNLASVSTMVEHLALRGQTLVLAGMCALDEAAIAEDPSEFLAEYERFERRRAGKPEQEPEAAAEA